MSEHDPALWLPLVKAQIRQERDDEDPYLLHLVSAATARFETFTGQTLSDKPTPEPCGDSDLPIYPDILHGLLLLIGQWYEYRENVTERPLSEMPEATERLWRPYVEYNLGDTARDKPKPDPYD